MTTNLLGLRVENYKRIELVELTFDAKRGVFALMGANQAGKSSALDGLISAIGGRKAPKQQQPVHEGADEARIVATFDDIVVTRWHLADGSTKIEVKGIDGRRFTSSEEVLSALWSAVSLDPFAFSQLSEADQVATLLPLIGFDPKPLDDKAKLAYDKRTEVNHDLRAAKARLEALPSVAGSIELVDIAALSEELSAALNGNAEAEAADRAVVAAQRNVEVNRERLASLERQVAEARTALTAAQAELDTASDVSADATHFDVEPIRAKLAAAQSTNEQVAQRQQRVALSSEVAAYDAKSKAFTQEIEDAKAERARALAAVKMPVAGMSISEDEQPILLMDGTPFSQSSTAVKVVIGAAIAMALKPDLKLIVVRDASVLDTSSREALDKLAKDNEFLVLAEFADTNQSYGAIIENGTVRELVG